MPVIPLEQLRHFAESVRDFAKPERRFLKVGYALAEATDVFDELNLTSKSDREFFVERLSIPLFNLICRLDRETASPEFESNKQEVRQVWGYFKKRKRIDKILPKSDSLGQRGFKRALDSAAQDVFENIMKYRRGRGLKDRVFAEQILGLFTKTFTENGEPQFNKRYLLTPEYMRARLQEAKDGLDMFRPSPTIVRSS